MDFGGWPSNIQYIPCPGEEGYSSVGAANGTGGGPGYSPLGSGTGNGGGGAPQKSPARKKCEEDAQRKYDDYRKEIPEISARAGAIAMWLGIGLAAVPGCVGGGIVGAEGGVGGVVSGCFFGGTGSVAANAPGIAATTGLTYGITYFLEKVDAKTKLNRALKACQQIP